MNIETVEKYEFTPKQLAKALFDGSAKDYAEFWFEFGVLMENARKEDKLKKLNEIGKEMSPDFGGRRKHSFKEVYQNIVYYEMMEAKSKQC